MTASSTRDAPADEGKASWATETLPLAVRRQLLERDLKKFGALARPGALSARQREPQQESHGGHPAADAPSEDHPG